MSRRRKRVSPENEYDKFYDYAAENGWKTVVYRHVDEQLVLLQVVIRSGGVEMSAPSVIDVAELGPSTIGLREQLERDAA